MLLKRGQQALEECESRLRMLLAEAATAGEYDATVPLARWARALAALKADVASPDSSLSYAVEEPDGPRANDAATEKPPGRGSRQRRQWKRKSIASGYPKFARFNDQLVKIGWSKKTKREYQHKAPRRVLDFLVKQLMDNGADGRLFTTDEVFPLYDPEQGMDVPSYQAYACLVWLRPQGLVEQVGRRGYRLAQPAGFREAVNRQWEALVPIESFINGAKPGRQN